MLASPAIAAWILPLCLAQAQWVAGPALPTAPAGRVDGAGALIDGQVGLLGGTPYDLVGNNSPALRLAYGTGWAAGAPVEGTIEGVHAGIDQLGRTLVFGGWNSVNGNPGEGLVYGFADGSLGAFAQPSEDHLPRGTAATADPSGRFYLAGGGAGETADAGSPNSRMVERFTCSAAFPDGAWEILPDMPIGVSEACCASALDGSIYVIGGWDENGGTRTNRVVVFNPQTNAWSDQAAPDLPVALTGAHAVRGVDHRIYVIGGRSGVQGVGTLEARTWKLDAAGTAWSAGPSMAIAREQFACVSGPDHFIWVMGGNTATGGTLTVEKLFTVACPAVTSQPQNTTGYLGQPIGFTVTHAGDGPFTYQWLLNGAPLADGPSAFGDISGTHNRSLVIRNSLPGSGAQFSVIVSNDCGSITSAAAGYTLEPRPVLSGVWTAQVLHPSWGSGGSMVNAVTETAAFGTAIMPVQTWSGLNRPVIFQPAAWDVTPANSVGGEIQGAAGSIATGWWWEPIMISGQLWYYQRAAAWLNGAFYQPHSWGYEFSYGTCVCSNGIGGYGLQDDGAWGHVGRALLWPLPPLTTGPAYLHTGYSSAILGGSGDAQVGYVMDTSTSGAQPVVWRGTASSLRTLKPSGSSGGYAVGISHHDQVIGLAEVIPTAGYRPLLWGSLVNDAYLDLAPGVAGSVKGIMNGIQVGDMEGRATVWRSSAADPIDLHASLVAAQPAVLTSWATSVWVSPDGFCRVGGYANIDGQNWYSAVQWTLSPAVPNPADVNGDGVVDGTDLALVLSAWGSTAPGAADLNGDGVVDGTDLALLLSSWS